MAVVVHCHHDARPAIRVRTLLSQPTNLVGVINLVKLEDCKLDLLMLVLNLLGLGVVLLLTLLATTPEPQHKVQRRFFLDVVIRESAAIFQLLASEDEALLIRRDA
jgi:hypothetical protein